MPSVTIKATIEIEVETSYSLMPPEPDTGYHGGVEIEGFEFCKEDIMKQITEYIDEEMVQEAVDDES
jgi:hypothetical protein